MTGKRSHSLTRTSPLESRTGVHTVSSGAEGGAGLGGGGGGAGVGVGAGDGCGAGVGDGDGNGCGAGDGDGDGDGVGCGAGAGGPSAWGAALDPGSPEPPPPHAVAKLTTPIRQLVSKRRRSIDSMLILVRLPGFSWYGRRKLRRLYR